MNSDNTDQDNPFAEIEHLLGPTKTGNEWPQIEMWLRRNGRKEAARRVAEGDWEGAIFSLNSKDRQWWFFDYWDEMPFDARYELAATVWELVEVTWGWKRNWAEILDAGLEGAHRFMEPDEQKVFDALPDRFTIHRGYVHGRGKWGLSWSLLPRVAEFFAHVYFKRPGTGEVLSVQVRKSECFAYRNGRQEREIISMPAAIPVIRNRYYRQRRKRAEGGKKAAGRVLDGRTHDEWPQTSLNHE